MGVWIEILDKLARETSLSVTPCVGVWIEIALCVLIAVCAAVSLPAWECGLKCGRASAGDTGQRVTPCVGVWIEMCSWTRKGSW